jgi:hypothetical protein
MVKSWNAHYLCAILGCDEEPTGGYGCFRCGCVYYDPDYVEMANGENLLYPFWLLRMNLRDIWYRLTAPRYKPCPGTCGTMIHRSQFACSDPDCDWIPF